METKEYMSLETAAKKWHSWSHYIAKACEAGQIPGAAKLDGTWIIPADLERPQMHIPKAQQQSTPVQHGSSYKDMIYNMTMRGFPDFNVVEIQSKNTTYRFFGSFEPTSRSTLEEKIVNLSLMEFDGKITPDVKAAAEKSREMGRNNIPSDDVAREYYLKKFTEIGFTEEEIAVLMDKINEHLETRNKSLKDRKL